MDTCIRVICGSEEHTPKRYLLQRDRTSTCELRVYYFKFNSGFVIVQEERELSL